MDGRSILVSAGKAQKFFKDRESYPKELCDIIEDIVSCNKANLSIYGGSGSVKFIENGKTVLSMSISGGNSYISDEGKGLVLIRSNNRVIRANAYFGKGCNVDFVSSSDVYSLDKTDNHVQALKDFMQSWVFKKGVLGSSIIIVDRLDVFKKLTSDDTFRNVYILYSE